MSVYKQLLEALPESAKPKELKWANDLLKWDDTHGQPVTEGNACALIEQAGVVWCLQHVGSIEYCVDFDGIMVYAVDYLEDYTLAGLLLKVARAHSNK